MAPTHTMSIILPLFPSLMCWSRKNLRPWKTLKIQFQLLQSIKHVYEMMFCNKTVELQIHALIHANVNTQLVETRKTCLFFLSIQIYRVPTWAPNWEYSSEHNGACSLAASHPIISIVLKLLLQHVLWNRPGAKGRFNRKCWPTSRIRQGLCEEETLRIGKVGNGRVL